MIAHADCAHLCRLGRAVLEMMSYFNWKRFAFIYTDDMSTRKCYSIAEGWEIYLRIVKSHSIAGMRKALVDW